MAWGRDRVQPVRRIGAFGNGSAEVGQAEVVVPGVVPQPLERLVHVQVGGLTELALGLFDDDPAVERLTELGVERLGIDGGLMLEDGDGCHVGERLGGGNVNLVERSDVGSEHVQRTDGVPADAAVTSAPNGTRP